MTAPAARERVARTSPDLLTERLAQLRALFPECWAEGQIDFDKLRAALGEAVASGPERFTFSWAGRSDAAALLQTPSRATLVPRPNESVNWDTTRNLFVEGDNLEVLRLLHASRRHRAIAFPGSHP
jgi:adenine-specific DNA-methyltransferase